MSRGRYKEILLCVVPTSPVGEELEPGDTSEYDVCIYTELPLFQSSWRDEPPPGQPEEIAGLPFVRRESLCVNWEGYADDLTRVKLHDSQAPKFLKERLLEKFSESLQDLFTERLPAARAPVRIWWSNEQASELEDLPWELLVYTGEHVSSTLSFVRGTPPDDLPPRVPLREGRLRLALIGNLEANPALLRTFKELEEWRPLQLSIHRLSAPPRQALEQVVKDGYELVHFVADGRITLGLEGILRFGDHELSPGELCGWLTGSRVTLLALSPSLAPVGIRGGFAPAQRATRRSLLQESLGKLRGHDHRVQPEPTVVYRACTHFASEVRGRTTVLAPVGPLPSEAPEEFWRQFYPRLVQGLSIEEAVLDSQRQKEAPPMALFLHHRLGLEFTRAPIPPEASRIEPTAVHAELKAARQFLSTLEDMDPDLLEALSLRSVLQQKGTRIRELERLLEPWLQVEAQVSPENAHPPVLVAQALRPLALEGGE
ncbi:MAG TPA: hypothetical protein VF794_15740 [Archangium sp.]|jgi:hypothetical protein|uniref:hypothetical protein n=1 Tax=Archangium sp. TaxID=1872627 RepID=UPI002ED9898B